jgi:hypothetical protein
MNKGLITMTAVAALSLGACAQQETSSTLSENLKDRISQLEKQVGQKDREISEKDRLLREARMRKLRGKAQPSKPDGELLPPNAKKGECYARVFIPPSYRDRTETVLARAEGQRIEITPALYKKATRRVLVKAESERLEVIPAEYGEREEQILVRPAAKKLVTVPAVYETVTERILVRPAYTTWKKGRGPIEKVDAATGEIMCLVEIPAEYRTVTKRVLKSPATTKEVEIPAVYKTVKRTVMVASPKTRTIKIPAQYRTEIVNELVRDAEKKVIKIPATYQQVTKREKVSEGRVEWREILCETNTTPGVIARLQAALQKAGHNPGRLDGVLGTETMNAVKSYQKAKGLPTGQLTIQTLDSLGVQL